MNKKSKCVCDGCGENTTCTEVEVKGSRTGETVMLCDACKKQNKKYDGGAEANAHYKGEPFSALQRMGR